MAEQTAPHITGGTGEGSTYAYRITVKPENTVGHLVPGMPPVAATPWLVTIAEIACYEIAKKLIEPDLITVGARVVIDHLGASKVGATVVANATLHKREKNRFYFNVEIKDGERTVATVEHVRASVSLQKLMAALG